MVSDLRRPFSEKCQKFIFQPDFPFFGYSLKTEKMGKMRSDIFKICSFLGVFSVD